MDNLSVSVIYNRKKNNKVEIRITVNRVSKYWLCSFTLEKRQWDAKNQRVKNTTFVEQWNGEIEEKKKKIFEFHNLCIRSERAWDFDRFWAFTKSNTMPQETFLEYMARRIEERTDLRESTKRGQVTALNILKEYGKIVYMEDLTYEAIVRYNEWLKGRYKQQATVWARLKVVKTYCHEAYLFEHIDRDPFGRFKMDKGTSEGSKELLYEDFQKIIATPIPPVLEKIRDIMKVQYYTGLAYTDLMSANFRKREKVEGYEMITGHRQKTGTEYTIPLFPEAIEVLKKYKYIIPKITSQQLNIRYRLLAEAAGIKYHISSHSVRKGCGGWLLNKGVPMDIVAKVLGHSDTRITRKIYAKYQKVYIAKSVLETHG